MKRGHQILTSDAGNVYVSETQIVRFLDIWKFSRVNGRPVSPTCEDRRIELGIRIGSWCFLIRRTKRIHDAHPAEWMPTPL